MTITIDNHEVNLMCRTCRTDEHIKIDYALGSTISYYFYILCTSCKKEVYDDQFIYALEKWEIENYTPTWPEPFIQQSGEPYTFITPKGGFASTFFAKDETRKLGHAIAKNCFKLPQDKMTKLFTTSEAKAKFQEIYKDVLGNQ